MDLSTIVQFCSINYTIECLFLNKLRLLLKKLIFSSKFSTSDSNMICFDGSLLLKVCPSLKCRCVFYHLRIIFSSFFKKKIKLCFKFNFLSFIYKIFLVSVHDHKTFLIANEKCFLELLAIS